MSSLYWALFMSYVITCRDSLLLIFFQCAFWRWCCSSVSYLVVLIFVKLEQFCCTENLKGKIESVLLHFACVHVHVCLWQFFSFIFILLKMNSESILYFNSWWFCVIFFFPLSYPILFPYQFFSVCMGGLVSCQASASHSFAAFSIIADMMQQICRNNTLCLFGFFFFVFIMIIMYDLCWFYLCKIVDQNKLNLKWFSVAFCWFIFYPW